MFNLLRHLNKSVNKPQNIISRFENNDETPKYIKHLINETLNRTQVIPTVINGVEYNSSKTENQIKQISPINNRHVCAVGHSVDVSILRNHIESDIFRKAHKHWNKIGIDKRIELFENISNSIESKYKDDLLVATMVGQGKSVYEAEIDSVCELLDFLNFNNYYACQINSREYISTSDEYNFSEINGLNGFVASITPFNFTAIGANLVSAPLLMGNQVIWKPSDNSLLSNYKYYTILLENNIPPELISFVPMNPQVFFEHISEYPNLGAVAFTGSSDVFTTIYKKIGENINKYSTYPRLVGETGGKNFHFVHPSADPVLVGTKTFESAFGYSGQKCSACSRLYIPRKLWNKFYNSISERINSFNFDNYGVINERSYSKTKQLLLDIKRDGRLSIIKGGNFDESKNYFIEPTIILSEYHNHEIFHKEYFAPILAVYMYDESKVEEAFELCKNTNKYALTGSIFCNDIGFIKKAYDDLRFNAGNFYINDKSTGSVVGRQPFGGFNMSGTNDKAGDINLLYRFMNQRSVKVNTSN